MYCIYKSLTLNVLCYLEFREGTIIKLPDDHTLCETPSSRENLKLNFYNSLYRGAQYILVYLYYIDHIYRSNTLGHDFHLCFYCKPSPTAWFHINSQILPNSLSCLHQAI